MKRFLILGYPRSGTSYATLAFMRIGLYCTQERDESTLEKFFHRTKSIDGLCTGLFVSCERDLSRYDLIYHQVRHPLKVITSAQAMSWRSMRDLMETCHIDAWTTKNKLYRVMKTWLLFTSWADSVSMRRYQVENMRMEWKRLIKPLGIVTRFPDRLPTDMNTWGPKRIPKKLTWDDLIKCDEPMARQIIQRTKEYGYEVDMP